MTAAVTISLVRDQQMPDCPRQQTQKNLENHLHSGGRKKEVGEAESKDQKIQPGDELAKLRFLLPR